MPLSLNEIRSRALAFSLEWKNESNEDAEAKSFWDGFFNIFGISRKRVATFETKVHKGDNKQGFIDLLWKGTVLIEHKSRGKDLERAYKQAIDYFPGLKDNELPRYIIVCDFQNFRLYDLETGKDWKFTLDKLADKLHLFDFISGYKKHSFKEQDPVNIKAAELMGRLHDQLKAIGYEGHQLEIYLVRLLFCLFADDTNIFEKGIFQEYLQMRSAEDGSDLAMYLDTLFVVLNTPKDARFKNIDEQLAAFPYVNGKLFEERIAPASFDSKMRKILLDCCALDWSMISPAIFGSLFQSVMDEKARRNLGAHYTSEKNIMKVIKPLFLDELWAEFEKAKDNSKQLDKFHEKLSQLRFLDPACGCGNFLIVAYRELRLLEIELLKAKFKNQMATNIENYININVDQFYGIEYEEFPAQIAQVAMWLIDHQMNMLVSETFGEYYVRLPLRKSANITHGNALRIDWQSLMQRLPWDKGEPRFNYIFGNPPFIGKQLQNDEQKSDMSAVFHSIDNVGILDYVTAWYVKAAAYLKEYNKDKRQITCAFVSTNSISQGEQPGIIWNILFKTFNIKIHFAHRTFKWNNEAKGNAAVHVIIIGFSNFDIENKQLFEYEDISAEPHATFIKNINPYLVEGKDIAILKKRYTVCAVPHISFGSMPNDGGHFLLNDQEKKDLIAVEPLAAKFIKPLLSAYEFINGKNRWCLWLKNANPTEIKNLKHIAERIEQVKKHRLGSNRDATKKLASYPTLFGEDRQPTSEYIVIPRHSSENRKYIPMGFFSSEYIVSDSCLFIPNSTRYEFGILNSQMHMSWVRTICGRIKSDFRYSNELVYNNFPWPENPTTKQRETVEKAAQGVLDARAEYPDSSLADLYDPNTMPPALVKAHQALDKAVDLCYRPQPFINETKRIEFLFELYDKYTAGLFVEEKKGRKKKNIL
ncbi:MAG: class I SAM-dependent DNA methyltransferase [Bacteroidetes bacterium]|nr:class I SAM-dependent DNA methyltransferase [Bacteroidota bacterium]